jgi:hypothetical protein
MLLCVIIVSYSLRVTGPRPDPNEGKTVEQKVELFRKARARYVRLHPEHATAFELLVEDSQQVLQTNRP